MKNLLLELRDKILPRKRPVTEPTNGKLKMICPVEHVRHRLFDGFIPNLIAGLIDYSFFDKKHRQLSAGRILPLGSNGKRTRTNKNSS